MKTALGIVAVVGLAGCGSSVQSAIGIKASTTTVAPTTTILTTTTTVMPTTTTSPPSPTTTYVPPTTRPPVHICVTYNQADLNGLRLELQTAEQNLSIATSQLQMAQGDNNSEGVSQASSAIQAAELDIQHYQQDISAAEACLG